MGSTVSVLCIPNEQTNSKLNEIHYFGLKNYGCTCYANSIIQLLYYCLPFRDSILSIFSSEQHNPTDLGVLLRCIFQDLSNRSHKSDGYLDPYSFLSGVFKKSHFFGSTEQHDAHEFLMYLLNDISDSLKSTLGPDEHTFIEQLWQGSLESTVECLTCKNTSVSKETFFHLSVDVVPNVSLTECFRQYCTVEHLSGSNQFFCEHCESLQDAQKSTLISSLPPLLLVHIKRFKYNEKIKGLEKLCSRVVYPHTLRIPKQSLAKNCVSPLYTLIGAVIHIGHSGLSGHYVCTIDQPDKIILFDDDHVDKQYFPNFSYGSCLTEGGSDATGYILLYGSDIC